MTLARPLLTQWLATVYVAGFSMGMTFFLGRVFGPEVFGKYSYIITLASLFALLQDGGFRTLIFREFTSSSQPEKTDALVPIAFGHLLMATALGGFLVFIFPFTDRVLLFLAVTSFALATAANFFSSILKGQGNFNREAWWRVTVRSLTGFTILGFIFLISLKLEWVFVGWIAGFLVALIFQRAYPLKKMLLARPDPQIYRSVVALLTIDVATLIYFKIDIVMLRHMDGTLDQVGFYAASSRILEGVMFILFPFANVFFRELRLQANDPEKFLRLTQKLIFYAVILTMLIVPLGLFFSDGIVLLCFGPDFQPGAGLLYWLFFSLFFMIPNLVLTQGALAINREKFYALGACGAALLNMILNYFLIPVYGARGAAFGTIATEAFLLAFMGSGICFWYWKRGRLKGES
ncbi:MAG: capsular polysaccharide biosynthesis protein [Nitrospinaceae bacterium]|nr:MAG: capsular polysaccharide biosynthesis protein [Nitrospinaceae bacterium]